MELGEVENGMVKMSFLPAVSMKAKLKYRVLNR